VAMLPSARRCLLATYAHCPGMAPDHSRTALFVGSRTSAGLGERRPDVRLRVEQVARDPSTFRRLAVEHGPHLVDDSGTPRASDLIPSRAGRLKDRPRPFNRRSRPATL
jgi:hypothetical protein